MPSRLLVNHKNFIILLTVCKAIMLTHLDRSHFHFPNHPNGLGTGLKTLKIKFLNLRFNSTQVQIKVICSMRFGSCTWAGSRVANFEI